MEKHENQNAIVLPIILKPCDWQGAPFGRLQGLPRDGKSITTSSNEDDAWVDVVDSIREAISKMRPRNTRQGKLKRHMQEERQLSSDFDPLMLTAITQLALEGPVYPKQLFQS